jgi:hypothetical protein
MATAKQKQAKKKVSPDFMIDEVKLKKAIPFLEDNSEPTTLPDDYGLDDPDMGLAKQFTNHVLYGTPMSPELQAIVDDDEKYKQFLEDTSLDPEMLEKRAEQVNKSR